MALIFSTIAIVSLLIHGMVPHHHHNIETENCHAEAGLSGSNQLDKFTDTFSELTSCCENHTSEQAEKHVCNLNVAASKQVSIELTAVFLSFAFRYESTQATPDYGSIPDLFTPSVFSEVRSLRAPPLT